METGYSAWCAVRPDWRSSDSENLLVVVEEIGASSTTATAETTFRMRAALQSIRDVGSHWALSIGRTTPGRGESGRTDGLVDALETQFAAARTTATNLLAATVEEITQQN